MSDTPIDPPSPAPAPPTEPVASAGADDPGPGPIAAVAAAEPTPASAVDLHVKLGPLQDPGVTRPRSAQVWAWALAGGGLAGLASWLAGEYLLGWFVAEIAPEPPGGGGGGPRGLVVADFTAMTTALVRNAALAFGLLGGLMGLLLGIAGGMIRSSPRAGAAAGLAGSALGVAAGVGASLGILPFYARILNRPEMMDVEILYAIGALGLVWGAIGAAGGAAFGFGMGGVRRAALGVVGGFLGGMLGAAAYELLAAAAFPLDGTTQPISNSRESRLLARALVALFTSAGIAAFVVPTRFEPAPEPPA
ncbi:hypothetical protein [Paludisphaera mucosa]|uniref:Uncharacterized protein n=1 Tax=Paludisphaera mucosa TaxID=3030827 RepID=A0ABT6FBS7_9BACT|nr:hypothetical protein [Paludisphaera mucosa]MDG3005000.1 hypothetical protein [Paludisphaera mucosa]